MRFVALILKADAAYLSQAAPTPPATTPPAGLLNLSPTDGGTIADDLDALIDAIAAIEDASGSATHILANPQAWAELVKLKTATDSNVSLVGAGVEAPHQNAAECAGAGEQGDDRDTRWCSTATAC